RLENLDEDLLHQVFGLVAPTQHPEYQAENAFLVQLDELVERPFVAVAQTLNESELVLFVAIRHGPVGNVLWLPPGVCFGHHPDRKRRWAKVPERAPAPGPTVEIRGRSFEDPHAGARGMRRCSQARRTSISGMHNVCCIGNAWNSSAADCLAIESWARRPSA